MARGISVYRHDGGDPLYCEPLGSESAVRESWSEPADALGLPLLAAIYERGFYDGVRWSGAELAEVLSEVARLEKHWSEAGLAAEVIADLYERAKYIRVAVTIAEQCDGFVVIT